MKIERDERKFDFHGIGLAIKKAREREGMTQEQLGYMWIFRLHCPTKLRLHLKTNRCIYPAEL